MHWNDAITRTRPTLLDQYRFGNRVRVAWRPDRFGKINDLLNGVYTRRLAIELFAFVIWAFCENCGTATPLGWTPRRARGQSAPGQCVWALHFGGSLYRLSELLRPRPLASEYDADASAARPAPLTVAVKAACQSKIIPQGSGAHDADNAVEQCVLAGVHHHRLRAVPQTSILWQWIRRTPDGEGRSGPPA